MKLKLVCLLFCLIFAFLSCDGNKGDDFSYGDYPDSVTANDDDYTYVKKDSDTAKKDDEDEDAQDQDAETDFDDVDDDEGSEIDNLSDEDNAVIPDTDNTVTPDEDNAVIPDTDNTVTPDEDNAVIPDTDNTVTPDEDNAVIPDTDNTVTPDEDNAVIPDTDNTVTPDDTVPDVDIYIEPVCGNFIVEEGEICEPGVPKPCNVLDPDNYQSGWATCKDDCSAWIMVNCVEIGRASCRARV